MTEKARTRLSNRKNKIDQPRFNTICKTNKESACFPSLIPTLFQATQPAIDIKRKAAENGMISLRRSGLTKIKDGVTTIEEVVRETVL